MFLADVGPRSMLHRKLWLLSKLPYAMHLCVKPGKDLAIDFSGRWMASNSDLSAEYM